MFNQKGQNTAEYAIVIALVVAAAVAMQTYVKRGLQGRVKDEVGDMATRTPELGNTSQYEPNYLSSDFTTNTADDTRHKSGQAKNPTITVNSNVTQNGTQILQAP